MATLQYRRAPAASVHRFFQFSLLGMLASGFSALLGSGYLDFPTAALTSAALLARTLLVLDVISFQIPERHVTAATIAYLGFYPFDYQYISRDFVHATVHLICFLASVKVLTAHTERDYRYLKVIAFLEILAACLLSGSLNFFFFLVLFLLFGIAAFAASEIRACSAHAVRTAPGTLRSFHLRLSGLTVWTALGILAMTSVLFFLLPRTARAAFRHLVPDRYHVSGFSNEVRLGEIGEISKQSTTVMHVRAIDPRMLASLKWRGAALGDFDGRRWSNDPSVGGEQLRVEGGRVVLASLEDRYRKGFRTVYEVQVHSIGSNALFYPGSPEVLDISASYLVRNPEGTLRLMFGSSEGARYRIQTLVEQQGAVAAPPPLKPAELTRYLRLPQLDPRVAVLAMDTASPAADPESRARAIERHLRSSYGYTTDLLKHEVQDPLAHFLFDRKKGHCEYFASSMAVMLRSIGIPSRVVTGFHGGAINPIGGWLLIRASDAHSWVEAYLPGKGWTTYDPTPPDPNPQIATAWTKLLFYLDAADVFWQEWVLDYNLEQQAALAGRLQDPPRLRLGWLHALQAAWARGTDALKNAADTPQHSTGAFVGVLVIVAAMLISIAWPRRKKRVNGEVEATALYRRLLRIMSRRGVQKPGWLTPREFARVLPASPVSPLVNDFTSAYYELRFGNDPAAAARMRRLLSDIEQQPTVRR